MLENYLSDLSPLMQSWPYDPNKVNVRLIYGLDGHKKIQMRIDLGLLQMEVQGRPDGLRPHGFETLLDYYKDRLEDGFSPGGSQFSRFSLSPQNCAALRVESLQFYYRYLSFFYLNDFAGVEKDTRHNLELFDFVRMYAKESEDRFLLEHYRPHVIMMNTRARACMSLNGCCPADALQIVQEGIARIHRFFDQGGREELIEECDEVDMLQQMAAEILHSLDRRSPVDSLREEMRQAVDREDYERAAFLRDEINRLAS